MSAANSSTATTRPSACIAQACPVPSVPSTALFPAELPAAFSTRCAGEEEAFDLGGRLAEELLAGGDHQFGDEIAPMVRAAVENASTTHAVLDGFIETLRRYAWAGYRAVPQHG